MRKLINYLDDGLLLAGCACILYGLSLWSIVITWVTAGLMLIGFAVIVGKVRNAAE